MSVDVKPADYDKVLAALKGAARPLSRTEIYHSVFGRHRTHEDLDALAAVLENDGVIVRQRIEPEPNDRRDKPIEVWEVKAQSGGFLNGSSPQPEDAGPPPGEGWLPKAKTLRRAQRGVVPAVAARAGRLTRKADAKRKGTTKSNQHRVSDEQRGATRLISLAFRNYKDQGVIEVQGDWIRLAKNPTRRPPHHWYESLLHFLAEGHPTLDGKWHRKPKRTLVAVMEQALGRKLTESEQVRRRPGAAGSWNPYDIMLLDFSEQTMVTLADIQATAMP
jgi:hypothetical protein